MAQRHRPAIGIDDLRIHPALADNREGLAGKGFVQFNDADVIQSKSGEGQRFGDGHHRTNAHDLGRHASGRKADKAGHRLQT